MNRFTSILIILMGLLPALMTATESEVEPKRTPSFTEDGSATCLKCHSGEKMRAMQGSSHFDPETPHTPAADHGCESCHGAGSIHSSRAHGGVGFPALTMFGRGSANSPRDEQLAACLDCHAGEETGREPIAFFGSVHDRRTINCSTCHKAHVEVDPISDKEKQAATCFRCHRKQREEHPRFEGKSINFDALSCSTCHDVHMVNQTQE